MKMRGDTRVAIEQAIARGCSNYYVMHAYGISYRSLWLIKTDMLDAPQPPPKPRGGPRSRQPLVVHEGMSFDRPIDSYYGPASNDVIREIVDALYNRRAS